MKVTNIIGSELALLFIPVQCQESIQKQCKQIWTFLEIFFCGKSLMFSAR